MFSGEKMRVPLGPPTWTTCVLTDPTAALVAPDGAAECTEDAARLSDAAIAEVSWLVAAANPSRADAMIDLEKYILATMCGRNERLDITRIVGLKRVWLL
jgi:hypothetical protein